MKEADAIGDKLRYGHQGFLANKRQLRMGGLAAIELSQLLRSAVGATVSVKAACADMYCTMCRMINHISFNIAFKHNAIL